MTNDNKANTNERGGSANNDTSRSSDPTKKTGQQSQDESRHQQDAAHHKHDKSSQLGAYRGERVRSWISLQKLLLKIPRSMQRQAPKRKDADKTL